MSKDEQYIERLQSEGARLASANKQTQDNIDAALAEVDRLKTVATELKHSNGEAETAYEKRELELHNKLNALEDDVKIAWDNLGAVKEQIATEQTSKSELESGIKLLKQEKLDTETAVAVAVKELDSLIIQMVDATRNSDKQIEAHSNVMRELEQELHAFVAKADRQKLEMVTSLKNKKVELDMADTASKNAKVELDSVLERIETYTNELSLIENNRISILAEMDEAKIDLQDIKDETAANMVSLGKTREEIVLVQAELKPLVAKRIDSINFMQELNNKEANLKKKYEDVGLEY